MHYIVLKHQTDFDGWRQAARTLVLDGITLTNATWSVEGDEDQLFATMKTASQPRSSTETFNVPAKFVELASIGTALRFHSHPASTRLKRRPRIVWKKRGGAITPRSSIPPASR